VYKFVFAILYICQKGNSFRNICNLQRTIFREMSIIRYMHKGQRESKVIRGSCDNRERTSREKHDSRPSVDARRNLDEIITESCDEM